VGGREKEKETFPVAHTKNGSKDSLLRNFAPVFIKEIDP
jgi:hypothetical protein